MLEVIKMSELDKLLSTATNAKKQPLWEKLSSHLPEIELEKQNGKTYKEIAEQFGIDDPARFSRALKKAKEEAEAKTNTDTDKNDEEISFSPTMPEGSIEDVSATVDDDEVENTEVNNEPSPSENVQIDDEAIKKIEELLSNIRTLKNEVVEVASDEAINAVSEKIMELELISREVKTQTEKYGNDAKKYVSKVTSQAISTIVKKATATIENKLEIANQEISKRKNKYMPDKWAAMAVISCLIIGGASYYAGYYSGKTKSELTLTKYKAAYLSARSNEKKWAEFVEHWEMATDSEKAAVDAMMSRSK
jgi:transposase-like protein